MFELFFTSFPKRAYANHSDSDVGGQILSVRENIKVSTLAVLKTGQATRLTGAGI